VALDSRARLEALSLQVKARFDADKRVLSFDEYLDEFLAHPRRHSRDAPRYIRDAFDHFGSYDVDGPGGARTRYRLFDQEFVDGQESGGSASSRLIGHERLQQAFYRTLQNFVREGRANRLVFLHGPNGSAKSTFAACIMRALEHYSITPEGAQYRFSWVFPAGHDDRSIGFGSKQKVPKLASFAHLDDDRLQAKLHSELRENPLLLLPLEERRGIVRDAYRAGGVDEPPPDWIWNGRLGHKNGAICEALLNSYDGDITRVLAHVQVERFTMSRRYRSGVITIGPELSVDASERQVTADRNLAVLPASLSALNLFETRGELVDGGGGLIEYSDLLKRPIDAWRYLLLAIEAGEVALDMSILPINSVLLASSNEQHLEAFRQHHEYNSFRARMVPLRMGYLTDFKSEQAIYDSQIVPQARCHVAPHATHVAALWAVLTRLLKSEPSRYLEPALGKLAADLTPMEKAVLYTEGRVPRRFDSDQAKLLRAGIAELLAEFDSQPEYEGLTGASPRELRTVLLDAAQDPMHRCLSPLAVLDQITTLCSSSDYQFLKVEAADGYHSHHDFVRQVRERWLDLFEVELRSATGLVEEAQYEQLFQRYVTQVSLWVKGERFQDPVTGKRSDPDETLFRRIEDILEVENAQEYRRNLINVVAAHAIDHPGTRVDHAAIFPRQLEKLREAYYNDHRAQIRTTMHDILGLLSEQPPGLEPEAQARANGALDTLKGRFGYCEHCARTALAELYKQRYEG
jgi:serine protein kinase